MRTTLHLLRSKRGVSFLNGCPKGLMQRIAAGVPIRPTLWNGNGAAENAKFIRHQPISPCHNAGNTRGGSEGRPYK
jgi:hypothetical protein